VHLLPERDDLLEVAEVAGGEPDLGPRGQRRQEGADLPVGEPREGSADRADDGLFGVGLDDAELDQLLGHTGRSAPRRRRE
jgi:hypothetical protein